MKTKEILHFPEKRALLFNHTLTKSLQDGISNVFPPKRHADSSVCQWLQLRYTLAYATCWKSLSEKVFFLGPSTGEIFPAPFESAAAQARLSTYVRHIPAFANRNVTLHGLRSGCTISLAIAGAMLDAIINVDWKSSFMAGHYIKLNQVLGGAAAPCLGYYTTYKQYDNPRGFTIGF